MSRFTTSLDVRPRHCDAQGMVHAARYYGFFEEAFLRWLAWLDADYADVRATGVDFVIVESRCVYEAPARLDDRLDVAVVPVRTSSSTLTVEYRVTRDGDPVATGSCTYVAMADGAAAPLPEAFAAVVVEPSPQGLARHHAQRVLDRLHAAQAELYSGGDAAAVREVLTPDVVWAVPGANAIAGIYRGVEEVVAYMLRRRDAAGGTFRMHPRELLVGVDHVAMLTDGSVVKDGATQTWSTVGLYRLAGDRIASCHLLPLEPRLFDLIWS